MKYCKYFFLQTFLLVSLVLNLSVSCLDREIVDLCQCDWRLWLDESAQWENDKLYFPTPGSLDDVAYNPPSCGWEGLDSQSTAISVNVPGTVEEYVHELGREKFDYIGVSWWSH